jgi:predicted MFS family arabinose efflux permease
MRFVFGLGTSVLLPSTVSAVSRGFEFKERTRAIAIAFSGNQPGLAAGGAIGAVILSRLGWQAVFCCLGGCSLLLTAAWFQFYPDRRVETESAVSSDGLAARNSRRATMWSLFRHRATWGIALGQMGYLYAYFFLVSWLPGYLILERKMTLLKSGLIGSLPFAIGILATLGGG